MRSGGWTGTQDHSQVPPSYENAAIRGKSKILVIKTCMYG